MNINKYDYYNSEDNNNNSNFNRIADKANVKSLHLVIFIPRPAPSEVYNSSP